MRASDRLPSQGHPASFQKRHHSADDSGFRIKGNAFKGDLFTRLPFYTAHFLNVDWPGVRHYCEVGFPFPLLVFIDLAYPIVPHKRDCNLCQLDLGDIVARTGTLSSSELF